MERICMRAAAGIIGVTAMAGMAWAGQLRPEWVAPDATWVVHLDAEALATSKLGSAMIAHGAMAAKAELDELHEELGIDVTKDVFGVTAFGIDEDESTFSVILEATTVIDQLLLKAPEKMNGGYRQITEGDKTIHAWKNEDEEFFAYIKNSQAPNRRLVLVSPDMLRLRDGMLRLEARAPGVNVAEPLQLARPAAGSILFVSASTLPGMNGHGGPAAAMMQNAKGLVVDVGENGGRFIVSAELDTGSPENATNILSMAQGFIAMGRMAGANEPEAKQFLPMLNALSLTADGGTLRVRFEYESEGLIQLMEAIEDHEHHHHHHDDGADDEDVEVEVKVETKRKRTSPER